MTEATKEKLRRIRKGKTPEELWGPERGAEFRRNCRASRLRYLANNPQPQRVKVVTPKVAKPKVVKPKVVKPKPQRPETYEEMVERLYKENRRW